MIGRDPIPRFTLLLWTGGTLLFTIAEVLAIAIIVRGAEMGMIPNSFKVYLLPLLVGLPWIAAVTSNARIRKRQLIGGADQNILADISYSFATLVVITYVSLIATISILVSCLRSIHALLGR